MKNKIKILVLLFVFLLLKGANGQSVIRFHSLEVGTEFKKEDAFNLTIRNVTGLDSLYYRVSIAIENEEGDELYSAKTNLISHLTNLSKSWKTFDFEGLNVGNESTNFSDYSGELTIKADVEYIAYNQIKVSLENGKIITNLAHNPAYDNYPKRKVSTIDNVSIESFVDFDNFDIADINRLMIVNRTDTAIRETLQIHVIETGLFSNERNTLHVDTISNLIINSGRNYLWGTNNKIIEPQLNMKDYLLGKTHFEVMYVFESIGCFSFSKYGKSAFLTPKTNQNVKVLNTNDDSYEIISVTDSTMILRIKKDTLKKEK